MSWYELRILYTVAPGQDCVMITESALIIRETFGAIKNVCVICLSISPPTGSGAFRDWSGRYCYQ